jgi:hypothetical protein
VVRHDRRALKEIGFPVPWDPEHFLAVMARRKARGETVYGPAYMIRADNKNPGTPTAEYQVRSVCTGAPRAGAVKAGRRAWLAPCCHAARPLVARAQQPAVPVIGFVNSSSPDLYVPFVRAWRQGLGETGYAEGRNVGATTMPALIAELLHRPVEVLAATTCPVALAAKAVNTAVPIVFTGVFDPVKLGLVASLARPGAT